MPLLSTLRKRFSAMGSFLWKADGSTAEKAAASALAIKALTGTTTDGYYWIKQRNGTPVQVYCRMSNIDGGGWMRLNSNTASFSHTHGSSSWSGETRVVNFYDGSGGCEFYQQYVMSSTLNYTEATVLIYRVTKIGQCSSFTNSVASGYFDYAVPYNGTYTGYGMCSWGDGVFATGCCNSDLVSGLKRYWVVKTANAAGNYNITYGLACTPESGQAYHEWWVR